jgi:hypothetical protein
MLKKSLGLALGVGLALIGGTAQAQQDDSVLWADPSHHLATFISGPVLGALERGADDQTPLSLAGAQLEEKALDFFLKETRDGLRAHPELDKFCPHHNPGFRVNFDPAPRSVTVADLILRGDIAVVGTVERTVPGIIVASTDVGTHEYLRVDEVLRDATHTIRPGQTLTFLLIGGSLSYKGIQLCTEPRNQRLSAVGDHLLLIGSHGYWESNPAELSLMWVFLVENGEVIPDAKAHPYLAEDQPKTLAILRSELAARRGTHE